MTSEDYSFRKQERIVSQKLIDELFSGTGSQSMAAFPVRMVCLLRERPQDAPSAQVLISVSKRRFKHAVDRNRVKRQIREAYRQHKQLLWESMAEDQEILVGFVWLSDRHYPSKEVEQRVVKILQRIAKGEISKG